MQVAVVEVMLADDVDAGGHKIAMMELHSLRATTCSTASSLTADFSLQTAQVHDLFSMGHGVSQLLLGRQEPGKHHPKASW